MTDLPTPPDSSGTDALPAACRPEYQRLLKLLKARPGKFQLLLLDCTDAALRDRVMALLEAELAPAGRPSFRLEIDSERFPTFSGIEQALFDAAQTHDLIHVVGGPGWFDTRRHQTKRWESFNVRREAVALNIPAAQLWWLDPGAIADMARLATDLWTWRAGVFTFAGESS